MPLWGWIAFGVASLPVVAALLFRIRYRLDWDGGKIWSAHLEYGFPGFRRHQSFPIPEPSTPASPHSPSGGQSGFIRMPRIRFDKERARRALFRFLTDGPMLRALIRFGFRVAGQGLRLLRPTVECAVGDPDPLRLARLCSIVNTARALPLMERVHLYPRFQDRNSTLRVRITGGFSSARAAVFMLAVLWAFPAFTLVRRAWHGWRNAELTGWRRLGFSMIARFS
jgi:hypothetical protein